MSAFSHHTQRLTAKKDWDCPDGDDGCVAERPATRTAGPPWLGVATMQLLGGVAAPNPAMREPSRDGLLLAAVLSLLLSAMAAELRRRAHAVHRADGRGLRQTTEPSERLRDERR